MEKVGSPCYLNTNINYNWFKIDLCGTPDYCYKEVEMYVLICEAFSIT